MNEKIIIRTFCGIENIEIELSDITVLIGPQATGKSICAKSLFFFKRFITDLRLAVDEEKTKKEFENSIKRQFEEYFPHQSWTPQFFLRYEVVDSENNTALFIQIKKSTKTNLRLTYSEVFKTIFDELTKHHKRIFGPKTADVTRNYNIDPEFEYIADDVIDSYLGAFFNGNQLFIPAGRSFFAILQSSIFSFLATNTAIDPFLKSFGSFYENVKRYEGRRRVTRENVKRTKRQERRWIIAKKVETLVSEILKGQYILERGKDFLVSLDGRRTNLANASSGQQETLPLALILKFLQTRAAFRRGYSIYLEEPEAHIFPAAQKKIIQLISLVYNASKENIPFQFLITTHSPYTLTALNNLIFAGQLSSKLKGKKRQEVYKVVDADTILDPKNIKCYSLKNGRSVSIISEETGLITSDVIDEVSEELSMEFDKLLDLG
jgi:predicted ATPase